MLVAICADSDDLNGLVPKTFEDAEYLMIIDADTNIMQSVHPKEDDNNIAFAEYIVEKDCEVLICGQITKEPFEIIAGGGVTRYDGSTRKVQRAYDYMKRGKLTVIRDHVGGSGVGHTHDFSCDCGEHGDHEEERELIFDAVISAAGLSSRMGDFKPLMVMEGRIQLVREIQTYLNAGVRCITIVVGHRMQEIMDCVKEYFPTGKIFFTENKDYATTQMLESARIGLEAAMHLPAEFVKPDAVFFSPVDVPLFTGFTIHTLMDWFSMGEQTVYIPEYLGKTGHPILINGAVVPLIMQGDESQGLRSVLQQEGISVMKVDVPDPGCTMDADTPEEFEELKGLLKSRREPDDETSLQILKWAGVEEDGIAHAQAVASCADEICAACIDHARENGILLHPGTIHGAAMLHDVLKGMNHHEKSGGEFLAQLGMEEVGAIVAMHNELPDDISSEICDAVIVFLADKMVSGAKKVGIETRFAEKEKRYQGNKAALAGIRRRRAMVERAMQAAQQAGCRFDRKGVF